MSKILLNNGSLVGKVATLKNILGSTTLPILIKASLNQEMNGSGIEYLK